MTPKVPIVIDTREQAPWHFSPACSVFRDALRAGDYSLVGLEGRVAIERKSLDDYVATVIREYPRFRAELRLLADYEHRAVVVEASIEDVLRQRYSVLAAPNAVLGRSAEICVDWGVPVYFCDTRAYAAAFAERYLTRVWRLHSAPTSPPPPANATRKLPPVS